MLYCRLHKYCILYFSDLGFVCSIWEHVFIFLVPMFPLSMNLFHYLLLLKSNDVFYQLGTLSLDSAQAAKSISPATPVQFRYLTLPIATLSSSLV